MATGNAASNSSAGLLARLAQRVVGLLLLVLGIAMVLTLVLLPIGLPLALVGVALIMADSQGP